MYTASFLLSSLFALTATALPVEQRSDSYSSGSGDSNTFNIEIQNQCADTKHFGLYSVTGSFQMVEKSEAVTIATNGTETIKAPFDGLGLRLSGHAEWGTGGQWKTQALAEFGYSQMGDMDGTAYNLSLMEGCEADIGVAIYPQVQGESYADECPSKKCYPDNCDLSQGWTNPDQTSNGSPADTVCYHGKTDFKVVFCP